MSVCRIPSLSCHRRCSININKYWSLGLHNKNRWSKFANKVCNDGGEEIKEQIIDYFEYILSKFRFSNDNKIGRFVCFRFIAISSIIFLTKNLIAATPKNYFWQIQSLQSALRLRPIFYLIFKIKTLLILQYLFTTEYTTDIFKHLLSALLSHTCCEWETIWSDWVEKRKNSFEKYLLHQWR